MLRTGYRARSELICYTRVVCIVVICHQVNPAFVAKFEEKGLKFVGQDVDGERMEILELEGMITCVV